MKTEQTILLFSKEEKRALRDAAWRARLSMSEYIRRAVRRAVEEDNG